MDALLTKAITSLRSELKRTPTPQELLALATPRSSAIHHCFEWNESKAAQAYRLVQASQYIKEVRITHQEPERKTVRVVSHQRSAPRPPEAPRDIVQEMLASAREELRQWSMRYSTLRNSKDLVGIFQEIDLLINPSRAKPNQEKAHGPDHDAPVSGTSPTQANAQGGAPAREVQTPRLAYAARKGGRYHRGRAA